MVEIKNKRLFSLDIFRIACALSIFLFHSRIHINIDYGFLNNYFGMCHIFMVAFFMLSGFSLFYVDFERNKFVIGGGYSHIGDFIKKRVISIYPLYITVCILFCIVHFFTGDLISFFKHIIISPVEITMLQSVYDGSFNVLHNGGTWFISCIFLCYLIYPYIAQNIFNNKRKQNLIFLLLLYLIDSYAFLPVYIFKFSDIYSNIFFRFFEFASGVIICKLFEENKNKVISKKMILLIPFLFLFLVVGITIGTHFRLWIVEAYNFIAIPIFGLFLYLNARIESKYQILRFRKLISILSENSYAFFLAQFFCFDLTKTIIKKVTFFEENENIWKFIISFFICCIITSILHYAIEKPIKKFIANNNKSKEENK